jgi:hypothetical protein
LQQYGLQGRQVSLAELQNMQRYGLDTQSQALAQWRAQQDVAQRAAELAQLQFYQGGQLGLGQAELASRTQQWQQQLAESGQQWRQQLAQDYSLAQMRMEQERQLATIAALGRAQAPTARWIRNF